MTEQVHTAICDPHRFAGENVPAVTLDVPVLMNGHQSFLNLCKECNGYFALLCQAISDCTVSHEIHVHTMDCSLSCLELSERSYHPLLAKELKTIGELQALGEGDLKKIRNIGPICIDEIKQKLLNKGFRLGCAGNGPDNPRAVQKTSLVNTPVTELVEELHRLMAANADAGSVLPLLLHKDLKVAVDVDCPIQCLRLSGHAYSRLIRASSVQFASPRNVGDVLDLVRHGRLSGISGLGPRLIGEIETSLVCAGFVIEPDSRSYDDMPRLAPACQQIFDLLVAHPEGLRIRDILPQVDRTHAAVGELLRTLRRLDLAERLPLSDGPAGSSRRGLRRYNPPRIWRLTADARERGIVTRE